MTTLRERCLNAMANQISVCVSPKEVLDMIEKLQVAVDALVDISDLKSCEQDQCSVIALQALGSLQGESK